MNKCIIPAEARFEKKHSPEFEYHRLLHWVKHHPNGFFVNYPDRIF
jgi:hypothetical protein